MYSCTVGYISGFIVNVLKVVNTATSFKYTFLNFVTFNTVCILIKTVWSTKTLFQGLHMSYEALIFSDDS